MKSFKEYLIEGQEEVDAAIKALYDAEKEENKIYAARARLGRIIDNNFLSTKGPRMSDKLYYALNRKAKQKADKRINPKLKKIFGNLSQEDRLGFLLSPREYPNPKDKAFTDQYLPGGSANQTIYDKLATSRSTSMFPLKDLRDAEDFLQILRIEPQRAEHSKDKNTHPNWGPKWSVAQEVDRSDRGDPIVMGGTFHERKKLRTELKKKKSS